MKNTRRKHKTIAAVTAAALALTIAVTGTYAWQSISQNALNEAAGYFNPGGRLHDDFDGTNKDVYVENFTSPDNGGVPIFARVRLDEYMEFGADAGLNKDAADRKATPVIEGATINDISTWKTFIMGEEGNVLHDTYWTWSMGGKTVFMPTFNKNKDSLKAEINGTFAGLDGDPSTDDDRYSDYIAYTLGQILEGKAVYDADGNTVDEGEEAAEGVNILTMNETHTVKETLEGSVMTMEQWITDGCVLGNYWVYDTDGWAYWANPINPGEATGLLLDGIELKNEQSDRWYYAVNVVAQFATAGDWGNEAETTGFYMDGITANALQLLNKAAGMDDITEVEP